MRNIAIVLFIALALATPVFGQARYRVIDRGVSRPDATSVIMAGNERGRAVGYSYQDDVNQARALVIKNGKAIEVSGLRYAFAVNNRGDVGGSTLAGNAAIMRGTKVVDLGFAGAVRAITDNGTAVGDYYPNGGMSRAFVWTDYNQNGVVDSYEFIDLHIFGLYSQAFAVSSRGFICGTYRMADGTFDHAWRFFDSNGNGVVEDGELVDLTPSSQFDGISYATDVNNRGQVVGAVIETGDHYRTPVVWELDGSLRMLPVPEGPGNANSINDRGEVVGSANQLNVPRAVLWTEEGLIFLDMLESGMRAEAFHITESGRIYGWSESKPDRHYHAVEWRQVNK